MHKDGPWQAAGVIMVPKNFKFCASLRYGPQNFYIVAPDKAETIR